MCLLDSKETWIEIFPPTTDGGSLYYTDFSIKWQIVHFSAFILASIGPNVAKKANALYDFLLS